MSTIFIYGRPGSGKTTLACSMTKLNHIVNIIDVDQKADKMLNIKPLVDSGKVKVIPINEKLTELTMKQRMLTPQLALAKQPKGYLKICEIIEEYEKEIEEGKVRQNEVLVIDSITSQLEHMKRLISQTQKRDKFSFDEWAIYLASLEEFFYTIVRLQKLFKHIIVIAHEVSELDDSGRVVNILPSIEGSMKNKVSKYFEEAYHAKVKVVNGKAAYKVTTIPMDKAEARTSRALPAEVEADFSILFKEELQK